MAGKHNHRSQYHKEACLCLPGLPVAQCESSLLGLHFLYSGGCLPEHKLRKNGKKLCKNESHQISRGLPKIKNFVTKRYSFKSEHKSRAWRAQPKQCSRTTRAHREQCSRCAHTLPLLVACPHILTSLCSN